MIDLHIVVLLITIAHCNIYINKVVLWLFLRNQRHLYFLGRVQYRITWHFLQADMPANVSEALCCMFLKHCLHVWCWTRPMYVYTTICLRQKVSCRCPEPKMAHRMGIHLVLYDGFFQPIQCTW